MAFVFVMFLTTLCRAIGVIDNIIEDDISKAMRARVVEASHRQAIYAYNIASAANPAFSPIRFSDDLRFDTKGLAPDAAFNLELEMAMMNENRLKQATLLKLMSTRGSIKSKIYTFGKGG